MSKKRIIWLLLAALMILSLLVACGGKATEAPEAEEPMAEEPAAEEPAAEEPAAGSQQVEVFSWWTGGGEAAGLEAMQKVFAQEYPNIEFINAAVAGGAGTNARAVLATRLQAGDPPDSWQASHPASHSDPTDF